MDLLLVTNEPGFARKVRHSLRVAGHSVSLTTDGRTGFELLTNKHFDVVLLAASMPGLNGFELLACIRQAGLRTKVLMIASWEEIGSRVSELRTEIDDYLTQPFETEELMDRVDSLGRRESKLPFLCLGGLSMEVANRKVSLDGELLTLPPREFEVLHLLMSEPGRIFSRSELCERIWGVVHRYDTRTVEVVIMRLRKKLNRPGSPPLIQTVRCLGYVMPRRPPTADQRQGLT